MATPLIRLDGEKKAKIKVSSVLNRDSRQFGKKYMFDGLEETCWNSDQGSPQYVIVDLGQPAVLTELHIQFQGGFACRDCEVSTLDREGRHLTHFHPSDSNSVQIFPLLGTAAETHQVYKIVFRNSTDFFGRVTVYLLQLYGTWHNQTS